ncbi:glutathione peroxidase [Roseobacter denitrificans]|uniref:Glutathione peroxidase n=1 Tax=Roseobacter denitrificans (strain ATCC 33942 / OCh 114) TaxID=375451 RepID=Q16CJ4_ROSDO|nr:glutathione peroxidase [Roseobacter denitrificans]ABG30299.1 glutathione peroxidase, putative [Roseobacter denitrificans OCh 114]AVL53472.1 glutathione peroxidase [Roseobacter denitrificans]SFF71335.1 glutathione peroxidase [Roseobacter denitrificans OCh 114]
MKALKSTVAALVTAAFVAGPVCAGARDHQFASIDGGFVDMADWAGQPVLVVNTASQCGFTGQYAGLQELYDTYRAAGLVVFAVPSDDFNQELGSAEEVKEFCEMNFGLDLPMADITRIRGKNAHPFYQDVRAETGFVPRWNFNKVLIGPDGEIVDTWGSQTKPMSREITDAVETLLDQASQG